MFSLGVRAAESFALVSGVDCFCLDVEPSGTVAPGGCAICDGTLRGYPSPRSADPIHRFAAYQSERFGGRYVYVCNYTLLHVAAPIVRGDALRAVLVSGPAVLGTDDDEIVPAVRGLGAGALLSDDAVRAWVGSLPRLSAPQATALADILMRVAFSCCDREAADLFEQVGALGGDDSDSVGRLDGDAFRTYLVHLTSMEGQKSSSMRYPIEAERKLLDCVTAGDRERAEQLLGEIVAAVGGRETDSVAEARSRVLELVVLISRAAIAGGADTEMVFGLEYHSLRALRSVSSIDEIERWLRRILRRFVDLVFDLRHLRYSAHLSRVLQHIREHYREPISLGGVAADIGLSPGHLGRVFRSQLRMGFRSYVNAVRIDEAKRLLRGTSTPIGDVAAACGFLDQSYFAQAFRSIVGMSPSEYRLQKA